MTQKADSLADGTEELALQAEGGEAWMFQNQFFPEETFRVVSGELENFPVPDSVGEGQAFTEFEARIIQYTNAPDTFAFLFPYEDAEVAQGVTYSLGGDWEDIEDMEGFDEDLENTPFASLLNVTFHP